MMSQPAAQVAQRGPEWRKTGGAGIALALQYVLASNHLAAEGSSETVLFKNA